MNESKNGILRIKFIPMAVAAAAALILFAPEQGRTASTSGTANATIVNAMGIAATGSLEFGSVGNAPNTITITPGGVRSATDGSQLAGGAPQAAAFMVKGEVPEAAFNVTLPVSVILANGDAALTVTNFTHNAPPSLSGGTASFNVGADLIVPGNARPGTYTGTFTVTVNY